MKRAKYFFLMSFALVCLLMNVTSANDKAKGGLSDFSLRNFIMSNFADTNKYSFELIIGIFVVIYAINYVIGRKHNAKYADLWIKQNKEVFEKEFSELGLSNDEDGNLLEVEGAHSFKFYASGRRNCPYARVHLELKKRQNILSMLLFTIFWPEKDRIRVEIPITINSDSLPFVLAIVRRKEGKHVQKNYPHIKAFCQPITYHQLEKRFVVLAENQETSDYLLTDKVIEVLKQYDHVIEMISFSDMNRPHKQLLRADLVMPHSVLKNPGELHDLFKILFHLVDDVAHYKMSQACRTKAERERVIYQKNNEKEERKSQKKEPEPKKKDDKKDDNRRKLQKKTVKAS